MSNIKKIKAFYAKQAWRIRQSSSIINLFFFSLTLAGIYLPYVEMVVDINKMALLIILYFTSFTALIVLGVIYDVVLHLWKEDNIIMTQKNPYQIDLFSEKELQAMKMYLAVNISLCESMNTNVLICKKLGIDCADLERQLQDVREKTRIWADWIRDGRIVRKMD